MARIGLPECGVSPPHTLLDVFAGHYGFHPDFPAHSAPLSQTAEERPNLPRHAVVCGCGNGRGNGTGTRRSLSYDNQGAQSADAKCDGLGLPRLAARWPWPTPGCGTTPGVTMIREVTVSQARAYVLVVSCDEVADNFRQYGLLDKRVVLLEGRFKGTLPQAPVDRLAVQRLDGDMYDSTIKIFDSCYHKLSRGDAVIVDDYRDHPNCRRPTTDFRTQHGITSPGAAD